jgi:hypothetical protein
MFKLGAMSSIADIKSNVLREKLLDVLKNDNLRPVIKEIEFCMYLYDPDNHLSTLKEKWEAVIDKIKQLVGERIVDLMIYPITEWAAAYIVAHEIQQIEELAKMRQINLTKHECNYQLRDTIGKMVHELNVLIHSLTEQVRKSKNENIYYGTVETIEKASSLKEYLSDIMDKLEKENTEIFESATIAKQKLYEIIYRILESL